MRAISPEKADELYKFWNSLSEDEKGFFLFTSIYECEDLNEILSIIQFKVSEQYEDLETEEN
ncbi:hypothetical protein [uncultured Lactobacillus sp.]|uniref:hypothetical protein n=1 Tax=uncultured Lactobacillus sp. TaxID=153152 RepID=UPI002620DE12|nr:hypothetical protein [uncultured Lactobacillus sp.]